MAVKDLVTLNVQLYTDPINGRPVANGFVFIGEIDLDPAIEANRKSVTLIQEDGTENVILPAAQPLTLGPGGYIMFQGSVIAALFVEGNYSHKILDAALAQVFFNPNAFDTPVSIDTEVKGFATVADMVADTNLSLGDTVQTRGYFTSGDGGDNLYAIVDQFTGTADGGSFIQLSGISGQAQGVFPNQQVFIKQFGAVGDGVTDDLATIQATITYSDSQLLDRIVHFGTGIFVLGGTIQAKSNIHYKGSRHASTFVQLLGSAPVDTNVFEFAGGGDDAIFSDMFILGTGKESDGQPDIDDLTIGCGILLAGTAGFSRNMKFYNLKVRSCKVGINLAGRDAAFLVLSTILANFSGSTVAPTSSISL